MTEMIFPQENRDLKLTCKLHIDMLTNSVRYSIFVFPSLAAST